ncbi:hypothetical protein P3S72_12665 [Pseudomonas sp. D3]|uniref:hypothetical protein n=1 Tax=Pseudomonas sp. D3 TaxID=517398 RepID=UPI0023E3E2C7|nr:hypothetical protein [Pseudomonas sp. D3]WET12941.1 hypothetical protein P3S72_12665 [Pseudomonas sp. D3]
MGWYKAGTASVMSGSNAVIGTGTSFIANSRVGDAFRGPDGGWYEVTNIASDTALSIAPNYQGATVAAGDYSLAPMQGYVKDSADALRAATQVIASGVADMQEQVAAATEAAESAGQSKVVATEQAAIATSAAELSADNKDAAQLAAQQSESSAQTSGAAADQAETAKNSSVQSQQAAAASAAAAAASAAHAEEVTTGKAASGDNNDITSLRALTADGFDRMRQGLAPLVGATASVAGVKGLVPAPSIADRLKVLSGAGTWVPLPTGAAWGAISGTLSAQSDLVTELNKYQLKTSIIPANQIIAGGTFTVTTTPTLSNSNNVVSITRSQVGTFFINLPAQVKAGYKVFCTAAQRGGTSYFDALQLAADVLGTATSSIKLYNCSVSGSAVLIDSTNGAATFIVVGEWV